MATLILLSYALSGAAEISVTTGEFPPFYSGKLKKNGFSAHILVAAFKLEKMDVVLEFHPWNRAMVLAENGKKDATYGWFHTDERAKKFLYSEPVFYHTSVFFHLKSFTFDWNRLSDLESIPIGVVFKNSYGKVFDTAVKQGRLTVFNSYSEISNFQNLLTGRVKLLITSPLVGTYLLNDFFAPDQKEIVTIHPKNVVEKTPIHLLFPKNSRQSRSLLGLFNKGLEKLKKSGEYDRIIQDFNSGYYDN